MTEPITVLIVDDHEVVRNGIRGYLDTLPEYDVVGEADSGEQAVDLVKQLVPDVVLMDLMLPGMDGVEATRIVKSAISYILKDMKMNKLAEAITKAHNGEVILHPKVASRVLQNIRKDSDADNIIYTELTERELDVLKLIASGYSNSKIAEELVISENTVKGHVSNILSKLHLG